MKSVDDDFQISFDEFLDMVSGAKEKDSGNVISKFFKMMMNGKMNKIMDD